MDIFERLKQNAGGPIGQYQKLSHGYYSFPKLEGEIGPHMIFRGREVLNWSLNNYLAWPTIRRCAKADAEAAAEFGHGLSDGGPHDERTDQVARAARARAGRFRGASPTPSCSTTAIRE